STASIFRTYNLTQRAVYADFLVNFDYNLTDDITFNANIGNNVQDILEHNVGVGGSNLVIDGLYTIGNLGGDPTLGSTSTYNTQTRQRRYSYFGQVDLGYKDFVFLNLTGRNDWTSVLPSDNNSYFYPSAGISFIPTKAFAGLGDG